MAANYLHGVETIEIETGPRPVKAVKSAVIALIGTSPCGPVNKPTLCLSESDAAQFGSTQANFTIPQALKAIYDHGAGTVVVINVLDPAKHGSNISNESITFDANNQAKLAHRNVRNVVLKPSSSNSSTFNTAAFSVDEQTGIITRKGADIPPGAKVCAYYSWCDPTKVTAADIIGTVNTAGDRTGMKLLQDTYNLYGFYAKILLAPVFCTQKSVRLPTLMPRLGQHSSRYWLDAVRKGLSTSIPALIVRVYVTHMSKFTMASLTRKFLSLSLRVLPGYVPK